MQIIAGYVKKVVIFRRKKRLTYTPIYKDVGKGGTKFSYNKQELQRET